MGDMLGEMNTGNVKRELNFNAAIVEESTALLTQGVRPAGSSKFKK